LKTVQAGNTEYLCHVETGPELCSEVPRLVVKEEKPIEGVEQIAAG
jgi:hypothetical protein